MSSINNRLGFGLFQPTINNPNSGFALQNSSDTVGAREFGNIGTSFSQSVRPVTSRNTFQPFGFDRALRDASATQIQRVTPRGLNPVTTNAPYGLVRLQSVPYPFFQNVPELGNNPDFNTLISASTQFQSDLQTVGPRALPGYPIVNLGNNPNQLDIMGHTQSFINSMIPNFSGNQDQGTLLPGARGGGFYYPTPALEPHYNYGPYQATNYPQFIAFPASNSGTSSTTGATGSSSGSVSTSSTATASNNSGYPFSYDAYPGLNAIFNGGFSNGTRSTVKSTSTDGKYNKGTFKSPFGSSFLKQASLTSTNALQSGVSSSNSKGYIKGNLATNTINGNSTRANTIDGQGGEDTLFGGKNTDTINVHVGDQVFTDAGNDVMFFTFPRVGGRGISQTALDGGNGTDTLVLTVDGNPTSSQNIPTFEKLADGTIRVSLYSTQVITRNIEKFVVTDSNGNIGSTYNAR